MLSEDNMLFSKATEMIRGEQKESDKAKIKALFIEGLINFLSIYAQSEICEGIEVNIPLVSLYVNSPEFENVDCYSIKNIDDVYKIIEIEVLMGMPIWRFLKLSNYQMNLFEKNYEEVLKERATYLRENYPCKRCIYFREEDTPFGYLSQCLREEEASLHYRRESIDWTQISSCKNCITVDDDIEYLKKDYPWTYRNAKSRQDSFRKALEKEDTSKLDRYKIQLKDIEEANISLKLPKIENEIDRLSFILDDFGDAFSNKRSKKERREEIKKALYLEGFIEFINLYIQNEIGSNYTVDITKVVLYLDDRELNFTSKEELFSELEDMLLNGFDYSSFIKNIE